MSMSTVAHAAAGSSGTTTSASVHGGGGGIVVVVVSEVVVVADLLATVAADHAGDVEQQEQHQHRDRGRDGPPEAVDLRRLAAVGGPVGLHGGRERRQRVLQRPSSPAGSPQVGVTRILQCSSGWASASNAPGTPSRSTSPVMSGATSSSPSAIERSVPANSIGS